MAHVGMDADPQRVKTGPARDICAVFDRSRAGRFG
jgi:hypothetical protein